MPPIIVEDTPVIKPSELIRGQTYIIRRSGNRLTHAVYLRRDEVVKDLGFKRKRSEPVYVFRLSHSGEEIYMRMRQVTQHVIKLVTGLDGILAARDIELD